MTALIGNKDNLSKLCQTNLFEPSLFDDVRSFVRSPLNYIGGKFKLLPQLLPLFPKNIRTFVDLFCGGCNVGINIEAERYLFNDNLTYLIDLYNTFLDEDIDKILYHIENRILSFNLSLTNVAGYNELRALYNTERNSLDLFVLVAYSFNHQIRFNSNHQFNNPFGKDRSCFNVTMRNNLIRFIERIQLLNCEFISSNFDKLDLSDLKDCDFVYCDPPYLITNGTYNDGKRGFTGWTEKEETSLLSIISELSKRNVKIALSNVLYHKGKENKILLEWIKTNDFFVTHLQKSYANSNYHTTCRNIYGTDEVLITNYLPK